MSTHPRLRCQELLQAPAVVRVAVQVVVPVVDPAVEGLMANRRAVVLDRADSPQEVPADLVQVNRAGLHFLAVRVRLLAAGAGRSNYLPAVAPLRPARAERFF